LTYKGKFSILGSSKSVFLSNYQKELIPERLNMIPTAQFVIKDSDILILMGPNKAIEKLREEEE